MGFLVSLLCEAMQSRMAHGHDDAGPTPDILKRTAYVAAYDRRLRHPSWASTPIHSTSPSLQLIPNPVRTTDSGTPNSRKSRQGTGTSYVICGSDDSGAAEGEGG